MKKEENTEIFSIRLKGLRARKGLTQADLAAKLHVSGGSIGNWESGGNLPSPAQLRKLADFFGVTIEFLLGGGKITEYPSNPSGYLEITDRRAGEDYYYDQPGQTLGSLLRQVDPNAFVIQIETDSMEPKYNTGDYVVVSPNSQLQDGDIVFAKAADGSLYFRVYHRDGDKVIFTAYNQTYPIRSFTRDQFRFIYPVTAVIRIVKKRGKAEGIEHEHKNGD